MTPPKKKKTTTPKDAELLELKLKDTEQKLEEMTELGRRAIADMENMKRRAEEDRSRMALFANINLIKQLLPILDNFKRAQAHTPQNLPEEANEWLNGVTQTFNQLQQALSQTGIQEIEAEGKPFDPNFHEAVTQDKGPRDQVLEVLEPGYILGDHVIRPAKVKVGMGE
jgi:molecular chaperone GrpE